MPLPVDTVSLQLGATLFDGNSVFEDSLELDVDIFDHSPFMAVQHVGDTTITIDSDTVTKTPIVTTDFETLFFNSRNPYPFPLRLRTRQVPHSPLDRDENHVQILNSHDWVDDKEFIGTKGNVGFGYERDVKIRHYYDPGDRIWYSAFNFLDDQKKRMPSWGGKVVFDICYDIKDGETVLTQVLDSYSVDVIRPLVILLNWDGVPRVLRDDPDYFNNMLLGTNSLMPNLKSLMGGSTIPNGVEIPNMYTGIPSSTFSSHATIYTGLAASEHNIVNNSFYDRVNADGVVSFSGNPITLLNLLSWQGPLDDYLAGQGVLYEQLTDLGLKSIVIGHSIKQGKSGYILPVDQALMSPEKIQSYLDENPVEAPGDLSPAYCGLAAAKCDENSFTYARTQVIEAGRHYDIMTIYTWDTDHGPHDKGLGYLDTYLPKVDGWIGTLWADGIEANQLQRNVVFVLFDDHGRVRVNPQLAITPPELVNQFGFGLDFNLSPSILFADSLTHNALMGHSGTITQIYLRDNSSHWHSHPQFSEVRQLAQNFWDANYTDDHSLYNNVKYIFLFDHNNTQIITPPIEPPDCSSNYCGVDQFGDLWDVSNLSNSYITLGAERLSDLAGSPNAPNMIVILKSEGNLPMNYPTGAYFKDVKEWNLIDQQDTVHGSLSNQESNILFFVFHPNSTDMKSKIKGLLIEKTSYDTTPVMHKKIKNVVMEVLKNSNRLFMQ